jgi:hypothetical protein
MMREVVVPGWEGRREVPGRPDLVAAMLMEELPAAVTMLGTKVVTLGEAVRGRSSWQHDPTQWPCDCSLHRCRGSGKGGAATTSFQRGARRRCPQNHAEVARSSSSLVAAREQACVFEGALNSLV